MVFPALDVSRYHHLFRMSVYRVLRIISLKINQPRCTYMYMYIYMYQQIFIKFKTTYVAVNLSIDQLDEEGLQNCCGLGEQERMMGV